MSSVLVLSFDGSNEVKISVGIELFIPLLVVVSTIVDHYSRI